MIAILQLSPVLMIMIGLYWSKHMKFGINKFIGYRTKQSMLNKDTWEYAHKISGKYMIYTGLILMIITILLSCYVFSFKPFKLNLYIGVLIIQSLGFLTPIIMTEKRLRSFNNDN